MHNKIMDAFGDLAALVWNQVRREPVVRNLIPQNDLAVIRQRVIWLSLTQPPMLIKHPLTILNFVKREGTVHSTIMVNGMWP